jgi:protein-S-isoprenylcysteine O-methyltransferase Ste14
MAETSLPQRELIKKMAVRLGVGIPAIFAVIFIPAGTLAYWEAWLYLAVLLIPFAFVVLYLFQHSPELLERRMHTREKETTQSRLIALSLFYFLLIFILPGLDHRFGWSAAPVWLVLAADLIFLVGYGIMVLVFRENRYASRVVEVAQGQQVITTGPYAVVRHPMYVGTLLMYFFSPLALGSYWALLPATLILPILVIRIRNEEAVLTRDLPGYQAYMQRTRYRLVPSVW